MLINKFIYSIGYFKLCFILTNRIVVVLDHFNHTEAKQPVSTAANSEIFTLS